MRKYQLVDHIIDAGFLSIFHELDEKRHFEAKDKDAFTEDRLEMAEKLFEAVVKVMNKKYPRDPSYNHVEDFVLPWGEHWKNGEF